MATIPQIYWEKRAGQQEDKWFKKGKNMYKSLKTEYTYAAEVTEKELSSFYNKYANENNMTYKEAMKYLSSKEVETYRKNLNKWIEELEPLKLTNPAKYDALLAKIDVARASYKVTRLDSLMVQINRIATELSFREESALNGLCSDAYRDIYYSLGYDVSKQTGLLATPYNYIDSNDIEKVMKFPWSGENFSDRIWNNIEKLVTTMRSEFTQAFIRGVNYKELSKMMSNRFNVTYKQAEKLVRTELAYISTKSSIDSYSDFGIEYVEFNATLDTKTSEICRDNDGNKIKTSEAIPGVNVPPLHPNCRSYVVPLVDVQDIEPRLAKDKNGKYIEIDSNIKYEEYYNTYIKPFAA